MSANWFEFGVLVMKIKYVQWRDGLAFYRRRIPEDVQKHYPGKRQVFFSLKTRDPAEAARGAQAETIRLDREWQSLRTDPSSAPATKSKAYAILKKHELEPGQWREYERHGIEPDGFVSELLFHSLDEEGESNGIVKERLSDDLRLAAELFYAEPGEERKLIVPTFSEVIEKHLYFHPRRKEDAQFKRATDRFIKLNGDLVINQYRREHANRFVKDLIDSNLSAATAKRYLNQIRPIFETAITELEIAMDNPLSKLKIPNSNNAPSKSRAPFTLPQLKAIQKRCRAINDQRRWVLSMLSDTGARLSEVVGLKCSDVRMNVEVPHIVIAPNRLRSLKSISSKREVPLVGEAL